MMNFAYHFHKLPYKIATLDIECLALHNPKPAIDQIGIVITNVLPTRPFEKGGHDSLIGDALSEKGVVFERVVFRLDALEQVLMGFVIEPETVRFREECAVKEMKPSTQETKAFEWISRLGYSIKEACAEFRGTFEKHKDVEEVWVLHPEFDLPRIKNLFWPEMQELPWHYRKTRDLGTFREALIKSTQHSPQATIALERMRAFAVDPLPKHQAINDCLYNLWAIICVNDYFRIYPKSETRLTV
jgi:hypothetical protein